MMNRAKHAIFAEEIRDMGWIAKYSIPGRLVTVVVDHSGRPEVFRTKAEAMAQAGICLCQALNGSRVRQTFVTRGRRGADADGQDSRVSMQAPAATRS